MIVTVIGSPPSIIRLKTGGLENGMAMDLKVATNSIFQTLYGLINGVMR